MEQLNDMLDELKIKEKKKEAEQDDLNRRLKDASTPDAESKIFDLLKTVSETMLSIQQERLSIVKLMELQVEKG
jgi:predicted  nucleic acid-binding Zn-ribbon protein